MVSNVTIIYENRVHSSDHEYLLCSAPLMLYESFFQPLKCPNLAADFIAVNFIASSMNRANSDHAVLQTYRDIHFIPSGTLSAENDSNGMIEAENNQSQQSKTTEHAGCPLPK